MNSLVRLSRRVRAQAIRSEDCLPDFRIRRVGGGRWKIDALSPRAQSWARRNINLDRYDEASKAVDTDLDGANCLAHRARMAGFSLAFAGPTETVMF